MNEFKNAKEAYDNTPIPAELSERVQVGIREGKSQYRARRGRTIRRWGATAACFAVLLAGLNLSPTIAKAAAGVPVLGGLFQVLTFVDYDKTEDGIHYDVTVPQLEAEGALAERVNAVVQEKVDAHLAKAQQDWDDYREAFFATGGTEEEWADREMDVIVDYEVKSQTDSRVSFVVTLAEGWVASMEERYCYNLDLAENRDITLADLLGENWVERCNEAVRAGIDASVDEEGFTLFFTPEQGGFTTVDENTAFYIREDGVPVLRLDEAQWGLVQELELNLFYDDGAGYIDLGLDNTFEFDGAGGLLGVNENTWLAIDGQPVAYYHTATVDDGTRYAITGRVPVLHNGVRSELLLTFDNHTPHGYVAGVRTVYPEGETDTVAKGQEALQPGDTLEFLCDYYSYAGDYQDSYLIGDPITVTDEALSISNVPLEGSVQAVYRFTDLYQQHHWTPAVPMV